LCRRASELPVLKTNGTEHAIPGIQAHGYFFTATELASIVNAGFFVNGMFEAIVARRIKPAARKGE
jgi:hypothetical protein